MRLVKKLETFSKSETGSIVFSLGTIILLMIVLVSVVKITEDVTAADVVLKNSLVIAVKAAADQYNPDDGQINYSMASSAFQSELVSNLNSHLTNRPNYRLIIYNGQSSNALPAGIEYTYQNGTITAKAINGSGFPRTFTIDKDVEVTFISPGAAAEITAAARPFFGKATTYKRWAAARVAEIEGRRVVVLQGRS